MRSRAASERAQSHGKTSMAFLDPAMRSRTTGHPGSALSTSSSSDLRFMASTDITPGRAATPRRRSVFALDHEERPADRACQFRLLPREFEFLGELGGDVHSIGELESNSALPPVVDGVHHVDRETALVE